MGERATRALAAAEGRTFDDLVEPGNCLGVITSGRFSVPYGGPGMRTIGSPQQRLLCGTRRPFSFVPGKGRVPGGEIEGVEALTVEREGALRSVRGLFDVAGDEL